MTSRHKNYKWSQVDSEKSHWFSCEQELRIYLNWPLDDHERITLTGWSAGISWRTEIDGQVECHNNPFESSLFSIRFMENDILREWREQIPSQLLELLNCYRGNLYGMLNICSRYPHVYELFVDSPTLFWLLFMSVQNNSRNEIEFDIRV